VWRVLLLPVLFSSVVKAQAQGWNGLVLLRSTHADVERLLGPPGKDKRYHLKDARVSVHYYEGTCDRRDDCRCLVPAGTVLTIFVEPEVEMSFSRLKLDKSRYKKKAIVPDASQAVYWNDDDGITYTVDEAHDDVIAIEYSPTEKDCREILANRGGHAPNRARQ
jgi:hypothetical protein